MSAKFKFDSPIIAPKVEQVQQQGANVLQIILTKCGFDDINDGLAGIDVGNNLAAAGAIFGSVLEDDDLGLKQVAHIDV